MHRSIDIQPTWISRYMNFREIRMFCLCLHWRCNIFIFSPLTSERCSSAGQANASLDRFIIVYTSVAASPLNNVSLWREMESDNLGSQTGLRKIRSMALWKFKIQDIRLCHNLDGIKKRLIYRHGVHFQLNKLDLGLGRLPHVSPEAVAEEGFLILSKGGRAQHTNIHTHTL